MTALSSALGVCESVFVPSELQRVSPKACAEELGHSFLPCVLAYLRRAPLLVRLPNPNLAEVLQARHVDAVVAPVT